MSNPVNEKLFGGAYFESPEENREDPLVGRGSSYSEVCCESFGAASWRLVFSSRILQY